VRPALPAPAASSGGREAPPAPATITGGRRAASLQDRLAQVPPTPLAVVGVGEALPRSHHRWRAWAVTLLTLLAAAEAFLVVHLLRSWRGAWTGEQFEELGDLQPWQPHSR
jgi:hypothetical protein